MLQTLWAFVMSVLPWPNGPVVKVGNRVRTMDGAGVLCDETGRLLLDDAGRILMEI